MHGALPPRNPGSLFFSFKKLSKLLEKSHDGTKQESEHKRGVCVSGWLYLSKRRLVEERKKEPKSSAHETKAKAGPVLPFLFFLETRQLQLRCN